MTARLRDFVIPMRGAVTVTAAAVLVFSALLFWNTFSMMPSILPGYPGDAFFPRIVLGVVAFFATMVLLRGFGMCRAAAAPDADEARFNFDLLELIILVGLVLGYVALLRPVGYEITTFALLFLLLERRLLMPTGRRLVVAALASMSTMLLVYSAFVLGLGVFMPLRFLPAYINF